MPTHFKVLQPRYYARFRCIGPDCEDTCCAGAGVAIDRPTYEKYRACSDSDLAAKMTETIAPNPASQSDVDYAFVRPTASGACPFLTEDRLCHIQKKLGETSLSRACATYPRALSTVDGVVERTLYMSCPEAARHALLDPEVMSLEEAEMEPDSRFFGFPELDTAIGAPSGKPYRQFHEVRRFVVALLQNRALDLWKRLIILGMFCEELDKIAQSGRVDDTGSLIQSFSDHIAAGWFEQTLANIAVKPRLQVDFLIKAMEYRIGVGSVGQRFLDCYNEFLEGVDYSPERPAEVAERYSDAYQQYARPFLDRHGYIFEHYLVNSVYQSLFPLGPQKAALLQNRAIFTEFLLLAVRYSLLRTLLVGMSGYHKDALCPDHVVKLIQSFAKAIEHNPTYLSRVAESLAESDMASLAVLAFLIKN